MSERDLIEIHKLLMLFGVTHTLFSSEWCSTHLTIFRQLIVLDLMSLCGYLSVYKTATHLTHWIAHQSKKPAPGYWLLILTVLMIEEYCIE